MKKYTYKDLAEGKIILRNDDKGKTQQILILAFPRVMPPVGYSSFYAVAKANSWQWAAINDLSELRSQAPIIPASQISLDDDYFIATWENAESTSESGIHITSKMIIGYKCPIDLYEGKLVKDQVVCKQGDRYIKWNQTEQYDSFSIPPEIAETWEPVYDHDDYTKSDIISFCKFVQKVFSDHSDMLRQDPEKLFSLWRKGPTA